MGAGGKRGGLHLVTLITKEGCSLCDKVEGVLASSRSRRNYELRLTQLGDDPDLELAYTLRIPVVLVDGVEVFEAKDMDLAGLWKRKLEDTLAKLGQSS